MATEDSINHMNGTSSSLTNFELDVDKEEFDENEAKKKAREPPVVYKDLIDVSIDNICDFRTTPCRILFLNNDTRALRGLLCKKLLLLIFARIKY